MRRSDRLFDIIQRLRTARRPLTAAALAERLEVAPRTIYRDIAALQARRVPIQGESGIGYVLRRGYELPPLMFTIEEVEAVVAGIRLVRPAARSRLAGRGRLRTRQNRRRAARIPATRLPSRSSSPMAVHRPRI